MKEETATSRREQVVQALARAKDQSGEGARTFTRLYEESALLAAHFADQSVQLSVEELPLAGVPVSIKDLFDVKGEATTSGSVVLADAEPAAGDAEIVRRLRHAGAAIVGKTNMTEFAFSGLGLNPHYGTPLNAWDRAMGRIPGGSSSGAAISVTDGMAEAAIGTDTGGSCRIPAALNGLVGFKPTARTVPLAGALPLSSSFDSIGPMAKTIEMCSRVYAVLSGTDLQTRKRDADQLTVGVLTNYVLDDMDYLVSEAYELALQRLSRAGVSLRETSLPVLNELPSLFLNGGLVAAEAYAWHRELLESRESDYDPRVAVRIRRGSLQSAADYIATAKRRRELIQRWTCQISAYDAVLMPTVPMVAPLLSDLHDDEAYTRTNLLMLRNPTIANALDACAISIPCHSTGDAPVGLTIACASGRDWELLGIASALRDALQT